LQCIGKLIGPHKLICEKDEHTRNQASTDWWKIPHTTHINKYTWEYSTSGHLSNGYILKEDYEGLKLEIKNSIISLNNIIDFSIPLNYYLKRVKIGEYEKIVRNEIKYNIKGVLSSFEIYPETYEFFHKQYNSKKNYDVLTERGIHQCYSISFPTLTLLNIIPFLLMNDRLDEEKKIQYDILGDDQKSSLATLPQIKELQIEQVKIGFKIEHKKSFISKFATIIGEKIEYKGYDCTEFKMKMICPEKMQNQWLVMPQAAWSATSTLPYKTRWKIQHVIYNKFRRQYTTLINAGFNPCYNYYTPLLPINFIGYQNHLLNAMIMDKQRVSSLCTIPSVYTENMSLKEIKKTIKIWEADPKRVFIIKDFYQPGLDPRWVGAEDIATRVQYFMDLDRYEYYQIYIRPPKKEPEKIIKDFNKIRGEFSYEFLKSPKVNLHFTDLFYFLEFGERAEFEETFEYSQNGAIIDGSNLFKVIYKVPEFCRLLIDFLEYDQIIVTFKGRGIDKVYNYKNKKSVYLANIKG